MKKKLRNPNTAKLWDHLLFENNNELLKSPIYQDKINRILKYLKGQKGSFLDIGFGMANLEKKIVSHGLDISIHGVDISPKTVVSIRKQIKGKFIVGNIFNLPFESAFFDVAVILDVIEHIEKDRIMAGFKEVKRVLKTGGNLVISVPLNENLKQLNKEGKNYNAHLREYTLKVLMKELNKSGFKIFKHEYLYAFRKFYKPKSFIINLAPFLKNPNLLIAYSKK